MKKAILFLDAQNIKRGARNSLNVIVDFTRLRKLIREQCEVNGYTFVLVKYYEGLYPAWVKTHDDPGIKRLGLVLDSVKKEVTFLRKQGFEVATKELRYERDKRSKRGVFFQKGIDVQMALDMVRAFKDIECELVIVGSGDEDFIPAIDLLKEEGAVVWIAAVGSNISSRMVRMAGRFIRLDDYKHRIKALPRQ
jgi:uncharacterized LabA/DUF88 family protein